MSADNASGPALIAPHVGPQRRASPEHAEPEVDAPEERQHVERPPFEEGNLARLKFGARSPRVYGKVAERLAADLLAAKPHLADYPEELAAVAQQEAIVALMRMEIASGVRDKETGKPRLALLERYFSAERAAANARDRIGLAPMSEAAIARERTEAMLAAVDLNSLAARGQAALDARASEPDLVVATVEELRAEYTAERAAQGAVWAERIADGQQDPALDSEAVTEHHDREDDHA